jgi:hypothetical protein
MTLNGFEGAYGGDRYSVRGIQVNLGSGTIGFSVFSGYWLVLGV